MAIDIHQTMAVNAPSDLVWTWLLDASNTIGALPGAKLGEVVDDRHFTAKMKVRVGTVSVTYNGQIELVKVDPDTRSVQISGKWKEDGGSGSATMELAGRVIPKDDGTTEVEFTGTADPVGRIVQFGKGMMQGIGEQLFEQFAKKASAQMEKAAQAQSAGEPGARLEASQDADATSKALTEAPPEEINVIALFFRWLLSLFGFRKRA